MSVNIFQAVNHFSYSNILFKFIGMRSKIETFDIRQAVFVDPTLYISRFYGEKTFVFKRGIGIERAFEALLKRFAEVGIFQRVSYLLGFALDLDIVYTQSDIVVLRKLAVLSESTIRLKIEYAVNLDDAHHS